MSIEQKAAQALLNEGIKVPVTAPLLFRVFGKRSVDITIRQPYLGTLYRISEVYLATGLQPADLDNLDDVNMHELINKYGHAISKIIALSWLNGYLSGKLFTGIVAAWFRWHINLMHQLTCIKVFTALSNKQVFTNTIRSAAGMTMTAPNLSQAIQGS